MTKITKILYHTSHVAVELDNGETLPIAYTTISQYDLRSGMELDTASYNQVKEESSRHQCRQKSLNYLAIRSRSAQEMATYLKRKGFDHHIILECIDSLKQDDYLNDLTFAIDLIECKSKRKTVGKNLLIRDLMKKGIDRKIIEKAMKMTDLLQVDFQEVYKLGKEKFSKVKNKKNPLQKVTYFLNQKGFDYEIIHTVIKELQEEEREFDR